MSNIRLKQYQFNSLTFVSIVDDADCPVDPYVSCYLNGPLSSKSANTTLRYANELLFILRYFSARGVDLTARVAAGEFISQREYMQFYDECCFQKSSLKECSVIKFLNVSDKHLRNVMVSNQRGMAKVASETLQGRIRRLRQYMDWLFEQFHEVQNVDEITYKKFIKLRSKIELDEEGLGKNRSRSVSDPEESVIPDAIFVKLLEMILPSSPNNPFKSSKIRNYLIISLLVQSGIRRGALAKLKISDFHFHGTYDQISIYRSGNDPTDCRAQKPNQKTKAHLATVDPVLMKQTKLYIDNIRVTFPLAQFHDFLLVSENDSKGTMGKPLSLKSINNIFQKLSLALGFNLYPHLLRHKWNETFDEQGARKGVDSVLLEDIRKYAMGWSQNTSMTQVYNDKRLAMKAREISRSHQQRVDRQK